MTWDEALARADGRRVLALYPFLRTETDFKFKTVLQFEGRNAAGYMGNVPELARDLDKWLNAVSYTHLTLPTN